MAVSTDTRHANGKSNGVPQIATDFNKFEQHASPRYIVGYKVEDAAGNIYRYGHFGADVNRGVIVSPDLSESSLVDTDNAVIAPASAVAVPDTNITAGSIGSHFVQVTVASVTAGQYAGGKLVVTDDTGEGYTYDVVGNTATDDPATGDIRLELVQTIQVAVAATSDVAILPPQYANLEIATAATDVVSSGVTCSTMDVSAKAYGWVQTKGQVGILQDGTIAVGDQVSLSDGTSGAVNIYGGGASAVGDFPVEQIVGYCIIAGDSTGHGGFHINME